MEPVTAMVGGMIGAWMGEWITVTFASSLLAGVKSKLNPNDLVKALKEATKEANKCHQPLFASCERGLAKSFLEQFFQGSGLQQLQKPLNNEGKPEVDFLVTAFKAELNSHPEMQGRVDEDSIKPWMEVFVETYFAGTYNYLEFQVAKEKYFKQLENYFDDVKFAGIAVEGQEIDFKSEKLDQIFVMLDVVEDMRTRPDRQSLSEQLQEFYLEGRNSRQAQLIREQQQRAQLDYRSGQEISAVQLLSQKQLEKVVLLGAPGSGKTTLMSYFAVMLAQKHPEKLGLDANTDWLPILIRIRDLARQPNLNILDYARQFAHNTLCVNPPLPPGFFESWLEDGRALILLDGLDEVPEEGKRDEVVRYIENFLGQFERNRAIITSRPAGYRRDFFRTDEFPHYELQRFDDAKIEEFINRWYDSRLKEDKPEAERCKDSLRKALDDNARIKLLARNPLLLTIITLIHRYRAILPKQRHELYDKAVETLLKSWDAKRDLSHHKVLKYLELDDLRRLMESVAYWIHTQASTGDKEGGTLIDRDELIEQLSREIKTLKQVKPYEAKEEAKRFVNFIRERTGLLNEQGQDCYAFVHKTFQEYLCAQEIIYQADNEDDFDIILNTIREHLHEAHWREVFLLLIAQQKPKKAVRAIQTILNNESEYEQWLHRDLLFTGSCLAENPKGLKGADNGLPEEILEKLVELEVDNSGRVGERVRGQVFPTLCSLSETDFEAQVLQLLKEQANNINQNRLQQYQLVLEERQAVVTTLLLQLQDGSYLVRARAAEALGKLIDASNEVVKALLALLKDADAIVRYRTAEVLGKLSHASDEVIKALLVLLKDADAIVRYRTAEVLGKLSHASDEIVKALLTLLKDVDAIVRHRTAKLLGKLSHASDEVVKALLALLKDADAIVRRKSAEALGNLGNISDEVVQTLLNCLKDEDSRMRYWAAFGLGKLSNASESVVQGLLVVLNDEDYSVRPSAALALGRLGNASEAVVKALLEHLQDKDPRVRSRSAQALGKLGNTSNEVVQTLLVCLQDNDTRVRSSAGQALGKLGSASDEVVQALLRCLQDNDTRVRSDAAFALLKLGNACEALLQALLAYLPDRDPSLRTRANYGLVKLGRKSSDVIPATVRWISQHQDSEYVGNGIDVLWDMVVGEQS